MTNTTNAELRLAIEHLAAQQKILVEKFDIMSTSVTAHHALDAEKCSKIDMLFADIHGDGNGKKGIRRELDKVIEFADTAKKFLWIVVSAAVTSVIAALISIFGK